MRIFDLFRASKASASQKATSLPAETRALDLADWPAILFAGVETAAGISINPMSAMRCTAVAACVRLISGTLATLPAAIYEKAASGERRESTNHPAYPLITGAANDWTPFSRLIEQVTVDALLTGAGFAYVNRVGNDIRELIRVRPDAVSVTLDQMTSEPSYKIGNNSVDRRNLIHIAAPGSIDPKGDSLVVQGREAIGLALTLQDHAARLFGNSARPGGVISFPADMNADAATKAKEMWQASLSGANAGKTAVLYGGGKWDQMTLSSVDAQFAELWERSNYEICRIFGVPPSLVYELGRATWGNAAQMADAFLKFGFGRWLEIWTSELELKLLSTDERQNFYVSFDTDQLLAADLTARATAYQTLIASRVLNPNECRAREDLPPYTGGEAYANPNVQSGTPKPITEAANND